MVGIAIIVGTILLLLITIFVISRSREATQITKRTFAFLLASLLIWEIGIILRLNSSEELLHIFDGIAYIGTCLSTVFIFFVSQIFVKSKQKYTKKDLLLFIIPIITIIIFYTNSYHHMFYTEYSKMKITYGWYLNVHLLYTYSLLVIGLFSLLRYSVKNSGFFSKPSMCVLFAILVPMIFSVTIPNDTEIYFYVIPSSLSASVLLLTLSLFKFKLLNIAPIAMQKIVDRMSDGFIVVNEKSIITDFNETFLKMFNIDSKLARNKNVFGLIEDNTNFKVEDEILKESLERAYVSNQTFSFEAKFVNEDKYFNIEVNNIKSKNSFLGILVLFKDMTQHKKDQELIINQEQLAVLGEVAAGFAHDLNSPLRSVAGDVYNLKAYFKLAKFDANDSVAKDVQDAFNTIDNNLDNMKKIVNTFRNQMINTGNKEKGYFNLLQMVESVKILLGGSLRRNNCILNIKVDENINIYGEDNKLNRVVTNLVKNSIEAYKENSMRGDINVFASVNGEECEITIEDKAGGIPDEIVETLFKERKTTKKASDGTGIGLYSSYRLIVADLKGKMDFETSRNSGTKFIIKIPVK